MAVLHRIDPRRSLAAGIGWLVIVLAVLLALAASQAVGLVLRATLLEQHGQRLASTAEHVASELNTALVLRLQSVSTLAATLSDDVRLNQPEPLQRALSHVQRSFPDILWMAVTDPDGYIVAATDGDVIGNNIYQYTWFSQGLNVAWIEEGRSPGDAGSGRFLKLTAPIRDEAGAIIGVVAARLSWNWVLAIAADIDQRQPAPTAWLLVDRDAQVRIGPEGLLGTPWPAPAADAAAPGGVARRTLAGQPYLVVDAHAGEHESLRKLDWKVFVIQPVGYLTDLATRVEWRITLILLALGLLAALLGVSMARRLTRRVSDMARSADAVLAGSAARIAVPEGEDEAARLGAALDRLLARLQGERDDLRGLNAELDRRVVERTREIERLAQEARYSAVVRERLRIARELHDTLAHSMMAMLTEIRVLKRLAANQPEALADELLRAEQAARDGLKEARDAIVRIRYNPARDIGLGPALAEYCKLFGERNGIACALHCDAEVAGFSEQRAETLYRMAQEALRNVERHAGARAVSVALTAEDQGRVLELTVADDGVGFDPQAERPGHFGLTGLHEAAQLIGAELIVTSSAQQGSTLRVRLRIAQALAP
jgi:signal transduction histidine kinase